MQANAESGLSERARERAMLVAEEAELRIRAPQPFVKEMARGKRAAPRNARPSASVDGSRHEEVDKGIEPSIFTSEY
jgi:hypothetical protein